PPRFDEVSDEEDPGDGDEGGGKLLEAAEEEGVEGDGELAEEHEDGDDAEGEGIAAAAEATFEVPDVVVAGVSHPDDEELHEGDVGPEDDDGEEDVADVVEEWFWRFDFD